MFREGRQVEKKWAALEIHDEKNIEISSKIEPKLSQKSEPNKTSHEKTVKDRQLDRFVAPQIDFGPTFDSGRVPKGGQKS